MKWLFGSLIIAAVIAFCGLVGGIVGESTESYWAAALTAALVHWFLVLMLSRGAEE